MAASSLPSSYQPTQSPFSTSPGPSFTTTNTPTTTTTNTRTPTPSQPPSQPPTKPTPQFTPPPHTSFPPFYTLQPNHTTRASQLASWSSMLCSYCAAHRLFLLSTSHPVFSNPSLNRRLPPDDAREVLRYMVSKRRAEWVLGSSSSSSSSSTAATATATTSSDASTSTSSFSAATTTTTTNNSTKKPSGKEEEPTNHDEAYIHSTPPHEYAAQIQSYIERTGQRNAVVTFYELTEGDDTRGEPFWGLPGQLVRRAVGVLVERGRAAVFGGGGGKGEGGGEGVKFFF